MRCRERYLERVAAAAERDAAIAERAAAAAVLQDQLAVLRQREFQLLASNDAGVRMVPDAYR